jgi:oligopeptidase A
MEQKTFQVANGINRQIYFSMLDLYVFSNKIEDIYKAEQKIGGKYLVKNIDKNDRFLCSFEHIFSGGYSAGYYSYIWAEIMSLDAFSAFEEVGLNNDEKISELGLKFRNSILAKGGSVNPLKVFKEFRGREPNSDAYMKNYGLINN